MLGGFCALEQKLVEVVFSARLLALVCRSDAFSSCACVPRGVKRRSGGLMRADVK